MPRKRCFALVLSFVLLLNVSPLSAAAQKVGGPDAAETDALRREIGRYNYVIGTNAFAPGYQFTDADPLMEVADRILAWGSNMVKFNAGSDDDLVDRVLEGRDFDYVFIWYRSEAVFKDGYSEEEALRAAVKAAKGFLAEHPMDVELLFDDQSSLDRAGQAYPDLV